MYLLFIVIDWDKVLANGITPVIILVVIGVVTKYAFWPRIAQYLDDARNERIEAQRVLKERAEKLEVREETQLSGFTQALEGLKNALETSGRRQETQIEMMAETLKLAKDTNDIANGRKRT